MLTKKRIAVLTVLMTGVYFALLWFFFPSEVIAPHAPNMILLVSKLTFLSMLVAFLTSILLVAIFKRNFLNWQRFSFNKFKYLLFQLVKRDFISRYRKSVLGVLWSLLNPLLTMLVIAFVFSYLFSRTIPNYPVYLLSGQILFGFFSESTNQSMRTIIAHESMIKKVYVPKYIFPLSRVLSSLVNLGFSFLAFLLVFIFTNAPFRLTMLLLPIPILYTFVFSLGVSMLLSALAVFFRDLQYLYGIFLTLFTYLTPLFYPIEIIPERMQPIMGLNPMYHFINYFRNLAIYGSVPDVWENIVCIGFCLAALCIGSYAFMTRQDKFILYL